MLSQPPIWSEKRVYIEFGKKLAVYSRWGLLFEAACREPEVRMGNRNSGLEATGIPVANPEFRMANREQNPNYAYFPVFQFFITFSSFIRFQKFQLRYDRIGMYFLKSEFRMSSSHFEKSPFLVCEWAKFYTYDLK